MNKLYFTFSLILYIAFAMTQTTLLAQTEPVMYFCERYDEYEGEVGVGDRFGKGPLTIIVRSDMPLNLTRVIIRYDIYNSKSNQFEYYKKSYFDSERDMNYLKFMMNSENNMEFEETGFYRVFLLDDDDRTVASALVEIIN